MGMEMEMEIGTELDLAGLDWAGLTGLSRTGPDRTGLTDCLDRSGLDWTGLEPCGWAGLGFGGLEKSEQHSLGCKHTTNSSHHIKMAAC
jgi:hypothetical protein